LTGRLLLFDRPEDSSIAMDVDGLGHKFT